MNQNNLLILIAGLVLLGLAVSCTPSADQAADTQAQSDTQTASPAQAEDATAPTQKQDDPGAVADNRDNTLKLKTGDAIEAAPGSTMDRIVKFLDRGEGEPAFTLDMIQFDPESLELTEESMMFLRNLGLALNGYPGRRSVLTVHTDNKGNEMEEKMNITEERAERIRVFMEEHSKVSEFIEVIPMGASEPMADNQTAAGRAKNNRVELQID